MDHLAPTRPALELVLVDGRDAVRVARDDRGNGPRLVLEDLRAERSVGLCPLELEALIWASDDVFAAVAPDAGRHPLAGGHPRHGWPIEVRNEFASIALSSADGPVPGLEVVDLRSGGGVRLSVRVLAALSARGHDTLAPLVASAL
jgi:hypothetical protein